VAIAKADPWQPPKVIVLRWKKSHWERRFYPEGDLCGGRGYSQTVFVSICTEKNPPTDFSANTGSKQAPWTFKREPASDKKDEN
jgi:hypothetical protein